MTELVVTVPSEAGLFEALAEIDGVELLLWDLDTPAPRPAIDIVVPPYWGGAARLAALEGQQVRLVQWQSIGYDRVDQHLPKGVPFANAATVHETSTAELAVGLTIAAQRGIHEFVRDGQQRIWNLRTFASLADRRVLLVGYGGIGKAVEARLSGFEVSLTRVARSARTEQNLAGEDVEVLGFDQLHTALGEADVVIIAVPLSDQTRGLFDARTLAALPDGALVVNVGRGPVIDTDALVAELQSGRLRAALDVTDPEPLPADHPLWECPNALITPHAGGDSSAMGPRITSLVKRQIAHLRAGETPENLIEFS